MVFGFNRIKVCFLLFMSFNLLQLGLIFYCILGFLLICFFSIIIDIQMVVKMILMMYIIGVVNLSRMLKIWRVQDNRYFYVCGILMVYIIEIIMLIYFRMIDMIMLILDMRIIFGMVSLKIIILKVRKFIIIFVIGLLVGRVRILFFFVLGCVINVISFCCCLYYCQVMV